MSRYAIIRATARSYQNAAVVVENYLPRNYRVVGTLLDGRVLIEGEDNAGWTLDGYVLPRLASGLHHGEEVLLAPSPFVGVR